MGVEVLLVKDRAYTEHGAPGAYVLPEMLPTGTDPRPPADDPALKPAPPRLQAHAPEAGKQESKS